VARHIFQACPVCIYTQSNITQATLFSLHFFSQRLPTNKGSPFAQKLVLRLASHWQFVKLNKVTNK
jgi:hypothetical protein